jgi:hypothetical protein
MDRLKKEQVYIILWDWLLLRFKEHLDDRQDVVRTLRRLVHTPRDIVSLLSLSQTDASFPVFSTILWTFFRHVDGHPPSSHACIAAATPLLRNILQHRSLSRRLACCDMLRKLHRKQRMPDKCVHDLEPSILKILCRQPRHERAVFVTVKYFMQVQSTAVDPCNLLPCGGMAWVKAIEFLSLDHDRPTQLHPRLLAPLPSAYDIHHLVGLWSVDVQQYYAVLCANSRFQVLVGGRLLSCMEALSYLSKIPNDIGHIVVPGALIVLDSLHQGTVTTTDQRFDLWEFAWRILDRAAKGGHDFRPSAGRIWTIVARFPALSAGSCTNAIRSVLASTGPIPQEFFVPLLRVLPTEFVHKHGDAIATTVAAHCCKARDTFCWDVGCVDFCCQVNETQHSQFVLDHVDVFLDALGHVDPYVRIEARRLLPRIPDTMFQKALPLLKKKVADGDLACTLAVHALDDARRRNLAYALFDRIQNSADLYSDNGRPSMTLLAFSKLPLDVLRPRVHSIVHTTLSAAVGDAHVHVRDRLFLLSQMPSGVIDPDDALRIADTFWTESDHTLLVLRIVVKTHDLRVYDHFKHRCLGLLSQGIDVARSLAVSVLISLPCPALECLLDTLDMASIAPTDACKLLDATSPCFLLQKTDFIVGMCLSNMHVEACVDLLAKVPSLQPRHDIVTLAMTYHEKGVTWPALRTVLEKMHQHDLVDEMKFTGSFT